MKKIIKNVFFLKQYTEVPQTPLPSLEILREDKDNWQEIQQNMGKALDEMRINWDHKIKIKELPVANNPLLERRMKKTKLETLMPAPLVQPVVTTNETPATNITDEFSRETTMIAVMSVSPSNSRPTTPTGINMQF